MIRRLALALPCALADGRIVYAYSDLNPDKHVANTLSALRQWRSQRKP